MRSPSSPSATATVRRWLAAAAAAWFFVACGLAARTVSRSPPVAVRAVIGVSVDSQFVQLNWANMPRKEGGLAPFSMPLVADGNHKIARDFGVLVDDAGQELALRLVPAWPRR